jgi:hypothetical protein
MISPQDSICVDIMDRTKLAFGGEDEKHRSHKKHERRRADGIIS